MKFATLVLVASLAAATIAVAIFDTNSKSADGQPNDGGKQEIRANSIVIVDEDGRERIRLEIDSIGRSFIELISEDGSNDSGVLVGDLSSSLLMGGGALTVILGNNYSSGGILRSGLTIGSLRNQDPGVFVGTVAYPTDEGGSALLTVDNGAGEERRIEQIPNSGPVQGLGERMVAVNHLGLIAVDLVTWFQWGSERWTSLREGPLIPQLQEYVGFGDNTLPDPLSIPGFRDNQISIQSIDHDTGEFVLSADGPAGSVTVD